MKENKVHVVPHDGKWAVKKAGSVRASAIVETQKEAIPLGKQIAKKSNSELLIHGENGKIREKNSYGRDPYPPKG